MFLTDRKLESRIYELKEFRYRDCMGLEEFLIKEEEQGVVNPQVPGDFQGWDSLKIKERWSGRDRYLWMHKTFEIPKEWKGKRVLGIFDFGNTGEGNNSGFESMLYLDGAPYQGVDVNHKEVFFDDSLCGTWVNATFRLWSGLEGGGIPVSQEHKINRADLAWLDEKADDLYYMGLMASETIRILPEDNPVKIGRAHV